MGHVISTNRPSEFIGRVNQRAADGGHVNFVGREESGTTLSFIEVREPRDLDGAIEEKENEWCDEDEKTGFTGGETSSLQYFRCIFY